MGVSCMEDIFFLYFRIMNISELKNAEASFLSDYPGGFKHPDMIAIGKKHKMEQLVDFARDTFSATAFKHPEGIIDGVIKMVSRSSMVSMFEKPKFRDFVLSLSPDRHHALADALYQRLYGHSEKGFDTICHILREGKLARWSLVSVVPAYVNPSTDVFMKPTTVKGIVAQFDLSPLVYKATPTWSFYSAYRDYINTMKTHVDPSLSPSNAAFSGFLMMSAL